MVATNISPQDYCTFYPTFSRLVRKRVDDSRFIDIFFGEKRENWENWKKCQQFELSFLLHVNAFVMYVFQCNFEFGSGFFSRPGMCGACVLQSAPQ
jgi:hypothetical protein